MKKFHLFSGMIVFCMLLSFGCDSKSTDLLDKGGIWELYVKECVKCHKVDGRGSLIGRWFMKIPDFNDIKWQDNASDSRLIIHVANGLRKMPGYKGKLKDEEIVDLVKNCVRSYYPRLYPRAQNGE